MTYERIGRNGYKNRIIVNKIAKKNSKKKIKIFRFFG
jgi:hypothetical protein